MRRWEIELSFDDIKTTMGMDFIRARSPAMAVKMVTMYAIAYNLVRLLMQQAARATGCHTSAGHSMRLSFKGALDATLRFAAEMAQASRNAMAQPATQIVAHDRWRLPAQASRSLRTQGCQTTTKTVSPNDGAARRFEAADPRKSCPLSGVDMSLIRVAFDTY